LLRGTLLLPLVTLPILAACADGSESRDPCERQSSCPDRRPIPILY
jgi:hypothetical protein